MTALAADDECRRHLAGIPHPERPERYDAIMDALGSAGLLARLERLPVRSATEDELLLCHTPEYLKTAERDIRSGRGVPRDAC